MEFDIWTGLGGLVTQGIERLVPIFTDKLAAPALAGAMLAFALLIIAVAASMSVAETTPVQRRTKALRAALGTDADPNARRASFAAGYGEVAASMRRGRPGSRLVRAWDEFTESIVDETETPIRNTARPGAYFGRALTPPQGLAFWSNLFVGLGLLLTFLGVVVALRVTGENLEAGGSAAQTQAALQQLLTVTALKFTTSIAGIAASLLLRIAERTIAGRQAKAVAALCDLIEQGMLFVSPQALAARQLDEVRRQTGQLEKFNTDLAISIGESVGAKFEAAVQPLAASLSGIRTQIAEVQEGTLATLRDGFGQTIEQASNGELRALGQTLATLREALDALPGQLQTGGSDAASQIKAAGETFAKAATDIRAAFGELAGQVDGLGSRLASESEGLAARMAQRIETALSAFDASATLQAERSGEAAEALRSAGALAAETIRDRLTEAGAVMGREVEARVAAVGEGLQAQFDAMRRRMEDGGAEASRRIEAAGEAFQSAASDIRGAFEQLSGRVDKLGGKMAAEGDAAVERLASKLESAAGVLEAASGRNAQLLEGSTGRLAAAGTEAAGAMQRAFAETVAAASAGAQDNLRSLATSLGAAFETQAKALAVVLEEAGERLSRIRNAFGDIERALGGQATTLDQAASSSRTAASAMSDAASGFASAAQPVTAAAQALARTADGLAKGSDFVAKASAAGLEQVRALTTELSRTQAALTAAWEAHRARFETVDQDLARAFQQISEAVATNGRNMAEFVDRTDKEMAKVADKLAEKLDPLTDYAETLDDLVRRMPASADAR